MSDELLQPRSSKTSMLAGVGAVGGLLSGFAALVAILREPSSGQVERVQVELKHPEMAVKQEVAKPPTTVESPAEEPKPDPATVTDKKNQVVARKPEKVPQVSAAEKAKQQEEADKLVGESMYGAYGVGGLGLVKDGKGTGEGTIGLGNTGLIGKGTSKSSSSGFGGAGRRVPKVRQAKATIEGTLDKDVVRRIVRAHINEVRHCYNQGLKDNPELKGRIVVRFTVGSDGKVKSSSLASSTLDDSEVSLCVVSAVRKWKFPKPTIGEVVVSYPFVLAPG